MVIYIHGALCRAEYIDMWMIYQLVEVFPESANIYWLLASQWLLASPDGEIARQGDDIQSLHAVLHQYCNFKTTRPWPKYRDKGVKKHLIYVSNI